MNFSNTDTASRFRNPQLSPRHGGIDRAGYYRVSDYELVTGWVGGFEPPPHCPAGSPDTPRAGFERALLPALLRSPCVVAFSGGRDSSAILAVATHLARREGLPDPLPVTHDFTGDARAGERSYQESVVRGLGLREWERFRSIDQYDLLGPSARRGLLRHGLLWPATLHSTEPMIALAAAGGSLVTGQGGDEVLGPHRLTGLSQLLTSRRPRRRWLRKLATELVPLSLRHRRILRAIQARGTPYTYLPSDLADAAVSRIAHELATVPLRWDHAVLHAASSRAAGASATNFRRLCADSGVTYHEPFLDPAFLGPLSNAGGILGWPSRTAVMRFLFGDVLADNVCARTDKAEFSGLAVGAATRDFLANWQGEGLHQNLLDIDAFRDRATGSRIHSGVLLLTQAAWLATQDTVRADPAAGRIESST